MYRPNLIRINPPTTPLLTLRAILSDGLVMSESVSGQKQSCFGPQSGATLAKGKARYAIKQLLEAKDLVMETIRAMPPARAALVNALVNADKQIMARKGIATPKPTDVHPKKTKAKRHAPITYTPKEV